MTNLDITTLFQELEINKEPLPSNYTPDEYAKRLMSKYLPSKPIYYSSETILNKPDASTVKQGK
jgi:hypothetical protein